MSSSNGWTWDPASGQYVAFSPTQRSWVNARGDRVRAPQPPSETAASSGTTSRRTATASSSSRDPPARTSSSNVSRGQDSMPSIESSMAQLYVSGQSSSSRTAGTASSSGGSTARGTTTPGTAFSVGSAPQPYAATHKDPATGIETRWEVSGSSQYTDPNDASQRSLNLKRIRQTGSQRDARNAPATHSEYRNGRVIEVLLVPPPLTSTDAVSRITPNEELRDPGLIRLRRFVIIRDNIEGGNSFEAIAIKTYNSMGVGAPGVIKSHHAVIYTGQPPTIGQSEQPQIMQNGLLENGMLPQNIRVAPYDKTKALDPMARLDFGDRYQFDHGVPNIRVWGRVHDDSLAALFVQYSSVWQRIQMRAAGPGALGATAGMPSAHTTGTATPSVTTTRTTTQRHADRSSRQRHNAPSSSTHNLPSIGSGSITDEQMLALLRAYRTHAVREDLHWPEQGLSQQQAHALAVNAQARATYFQRIRDAWEESDDSE